MNCVRNRCVAVWLMLAVLQHFMVSRNTTLVKFSHLYDVSMSRVVL